MSYPRWSSFDGFFNPTHIIWAAIWAAIFHASAHLIRARRVEIVTYFRRWATVISLSVMMFGLATLMSLPSNFIVTGRPLGALGGTSTAIVSYADNTYDIMPYILVFLASVAIVITSTAIIEYRRLKNDEATI